ncbi:MAG: small multi-drug export protein [bacterium]
MRQFLFLLTLGSMALAAPVTPVTAESAIPHRPLGERLAAGLRTRGLSPEAIVVVISMLPVVELRGAIPVGINLLKLPWPRAVAAAVVGNILPVFVILLLLERIVVLLGRFRVFRQFFDWLFARTKRRSRLVQRWEFWGLALFVAVPLPVTGAWTGSVAAVLMGLPYWRSMLAVLVGVICAAAIVTTLSLLGRLGALIAGVVLLVLLVSGLASGLRRRAGRNSPGR